MWSWLYISHNSAAGAVKELIKSKSENDIVFTRCVSAFFLAREFDGFHSLSLVVESKVSLREPVSVLHCFMYTLKLWFILYSMQFDQSEHFFMTSIHASIHDRVNMS